MSQNDDSRRLKLLRWYTDSWWLVAPCMVVVTVMHVWDHTVTRYATGDIPYQFGIYFGHGDIGRMLSLGLLLLVSGIWLASGLLLALLWLARGQGLPRSMIWKAAILFVALGLPFVPAQAWDEILLATVGPGKTAGELLARAAGHGDMKRLRMLLDSYEAGVSPIDLRLGTWAELGPEAGALRREVFVDELHIPTGLQWDEQDQDAVHVLVRNRMGQALATARLTQAGPGVARVARVAVRRAMRASGLGRTLMNALMLAAAERGDTRMVLQSQCSAEGFYAHLGFVPIGEPTIEGGIAHIDMARTLNAL